MKEKLINVDKLDNNQDLEVYDLSRPISEDAWVVMVLIRMKIEISESIFKEVPPLTVPIDDLKKVLGDTVTFEVKKERNFIFNKNKDKEFDALIDSFMKTNRSYLSSKSFPAKYVLREFTKKTKNVHHYCK